MISIAEVAAAHRPPTSPERAKEALQDALPLKLERTPSGWSPTSTARATPPSEVENVTASRLPSVAPSPRSIGKGDSRFDGYGSPSLAGIDTDIDASSRGSTPRGDGSRFDRRRETVTVPGRAGDGAAAEEEKTEEARSPLRLSPPPPLSARGDAICAASHPRPLLGVLSSMSSSHSSGGRRSGALTALVPSEKGLALFASTAWNNVGVEADTVPTLSEEAAKRWRAEAVARRKAMQKKASVLRFISTRSWDDPAMRVAPKKRRLGGGLGGSGVLPEGFKLDAAEAGDLAPAFCCTTPVAEPARAWDAFPPLKDDFSHVIRDPASRRSRSLSLAAATAEAARGRSTPEAEVKEEERVLSPTSSAAAAAASHVSLFNTTALAAGVGLGEQQPDAVSREAVLEGLMLPCGPSDDEKVLYHTTGRATIVGYGVFAFGSIFTGMLLFTLSSHHFYFYGVPTLYTLVAMCCHYFGVSVWGKDFDPDAHEAVVRRWGSSGSDEEGRRFPTVDVFLPVCNEPIVLLANTWNHVLALDYPHVKVHVLDDGAKDDVKALAAEFGFEYIRRDNRPELKKAGNLRFAFARTSGELYAIFDADFCPRPDFLRETVPYFEAEPSIGILQTPQFFRRREEQTWVEQGAGATQELFYRLIQVNLDRFKGAICVGSCAVYRRAAVEPFGGVAPIEHSEDMYTGYKMTEIGYRIKYLPLCLAMGICPDEPRSFFLQQYRWCMGTCTLVLEGEFWRSSISRMHKLCFVNGMFYYFQTALFVFLAPLPVLLLVWMKAHEVFWYYFGFLVPVLFFTAIICPMWSKQDSITKTLACHRVKVLQSYAHLYAIKDRLMGTAATWVPSGGGASKSAKGAYESSVRVMVAWNVGSTALIVGGSIWRITDYHWYNFFPPIVLALCSCALQLSTLWL
eukprot:g11101.t1